jgi:ubiquinone/menaquinone biosynthesis C-methylase UbiE
MQNSQLTSKKRKKIEANAWQGVLDLDSTTSTLGDIYTTETDTLLLKISVHNLELRDKKIINIGGGHGKEAEFLIKNGAKEAVIVDIALEQLKSAKLRKEKCYLEGLDVILGDAEYLSFKNKVFDLGYVYLSLHHFPDHNKSISEICRVSKKVIFIDIMNASITRILNFFGLFRKECCGGYEIEVNRLNKNEVIRILNDQKMDAKITYFFVPPYYLWHNVIVLCSIKFISKVINFVVNSLSKLFGNIALIEGNAG